MIELRDVSRNFGDKRALDAITVTIEDGVTFLVGPSGAGKSTLASIVCGADRDYAGTVRIAGQDIANRTEAEAFHAFNTGVGFVWQGFHLISSCTAAENVALPLEIGGTPDDRAVVRALRAVGMQASADQRVRSLSGGQRQRVAIARELVKDPAVIIADEPTSALDPASAAACMDALRKAAHGRCVLIITHDESLITPEDGLIRLEGGRITACRAPKKRGAASKRPARVPFCGMTMPAAAARAVRAIKSGALRSAAVLACAVAVAALVAPALGGAVSQQADGAFAELIASYGEGALDISVIRSFVGAGGADDQQSGPNVDIDQDISGLFERYARDSRVKAVYANQPYDDISLELDGKLVQVQSSGSAPALNRLVAGEMPDSAKNEVVVPQAVARELGVDPEELLGKTISFRASITTWQGGEPVWKPVETTAVVSGVADTTQHTSFDGQMYDFEIEDAFFFSAKTTVALREQVGKTDDPDFTIRPASPEAMIELKDELSAQGIVPIGNFELVENTVRLQESTAQQSGTASMAVVAAAGALGIAVYAGVAWGRRRELAIMRICGCARGDLVRTLGIEGAMLLAVTVVAGSLAGFAASGVSGALTWAAIAAAAVLVAYLFQLAVALLSNPFAVLKRARR